MARNIKKWAAMLTGALGVIFLGIVAVTKSFNMDFSGYFLPIVLIAVGLGLFIQGSVKSLRDLSKIVRKSSLKMRNFVHLTSSFVGGALVILGVLLLPVGILGTVPDMAVLTIMWIGLVWHVIEVFVK